MDLSVFVTLTGNYVQFIVLKSCTVNKKPQNCTRRHACEHHCGQVSIVFDESLDYVYESTKILSNSLKYISDRGSFSLAGISLCDYSSSSSSCRRRIVD